MRDPLPHCIKAIVQRYDNPEETVARIREVFPYWSEKAIHQTASVDRLTTDDPAYIAKLDSLIDCTGKVPEKSVA